MSCTPMLIKSEKTRSAATSRVDCQRGCMGASSHLALQPHAHTRRIAGHSPLLPPSEVPHADVRDCHPPAVGQCHAAQSTAAHPPHMDGQQGTRMHAACY